MNSVVILSLIGAVSLGWLIVQLLSVVMLDRTMIMDDKGQRMNAKQLIRFQGRSIVENLANGGKSASIRDASIDLMTEQEKVSKQKQPEEMKEHSLLVAMNIKIRTEDEIAREIQWIKEDRNEVCKFHPTCDWDINVVLHNDTLKELFVEAVEQAALSMSSSNGDVSFRATVFSGNFNKFSFLQGKIDNMAKYDLFLFKDSDIRINSFSWRTFIIKKGNAVVSTLIRRSPSECSTKRQNFRIYEACQYENPTTPTWATDLTKGIIAVEVPSTEQYFQLMDGKFASFYFDLALRPSLIQKMSSWGVNECWCAAAKAWDKSRRGCYLVPVIAQHKDTRQIKLDYDFREGFRAIHQYHSDPILGKWCDASSKWMKVIARKDLDQIEQDCRADLGLNAADPFDIQACATAAGLLKSTAYEGPEALEHIVDELNKYKVGIELNGDSALTLTLGEDVKMLERAKNKLEERLHGMDRNRD